MAERQTNYTIGEGMELPSKGLIYDVPVNSYVELRSMTARDEMKRLSPSTSQFKTLADIIEGCMIEKPAVHVYDMALGDYEYLLHRLRIVTYGDEYKVTIRCPYCGKEVETIAHLEHLVLKDFDKEKYDTAKTITLPRSKHTITLKPQSPRTLDENENKVKDLKRKFKGAEMSFELLILISSAIDLVDGVKITGSIIYDNQNILDENIAFNSYGRGNINGKTLYLTLDGGSNKFEIYDKGSH
jgi:hypothetical protein